MKATKKLARKFFFPTVINLGLEKLWRNTSRNNILNILYHGVVSTDSSSFSPRHITRDQFIKHLSYLTREFDIISLPEAFEVYRSDRTLKRKTLTISFDDGYQNNVEIALPLLETFKTPATFFISSICTQEMEIRALWTDLVACLNYFHNNESIDIDGMCFINLRNKSQNIHLIDFLKAQQPLHRDRLIHELTQKYDLITKIHTLPEEIWKLQTKIELQKLSSSPLVTIGSHGHLHYNLGEIPCSAASNELKNSKLLLENALQKEITLFAYPDGSYTEEVKDQAEQAGYIYQLAVKYKCENDFNDIRILPRYGTAATTTFESNMFFINKAFQTVGFN